MAKGRKTSRFSDLGDSGKKLEDKLVNAEETQNSSITPVEVNEETIENAESVEAVVKIVESGGEGKTVGKEEKPVKSAKKDSVVIDSSFFDVDTSGAVQNIPFNQKSHDRLNLLSSLFEKPKVKIANAIIAAFWEEHKELIRKMDKEKQKKNNLFD